MEERLVKSKHIDGAKVKLAKGYNGDTTRYKTARRYKTGILQALRHPGDNPAVIWDSKKNPDFYLSTELAYTENEEVNKFSETIKRVDKYLDNLAKVM